MICEICKCDTHVVHIISDRHEKACRECYKIMEKLTKSFRRSEFTCRCGCGFDGVNTDFINHLQIARDVSGVIYKITSGCRCIIHNRKEGGKSSSDHLTGEGADIETPNSHIRFKVLKGLFAAGFRRIGIGKEFVHAGSAVRNPAGVSWLYS